MKILTDPIMMIFIIIIFGYLVEKAKIFGFSFGIASILPVGVLVGVLIKSKAFEVNVDRFLLTTQTISSFGTVLFIAAIGLTSGNLIRKRFSRIHLYGFFIGSLMVLSSVLSMQILKKLPIDYSTLTGILCGALTSSPGLAALSDSSHINQSAATIGYGSAYLYGVFGIVLFVQIIGKYKKCQPAQPIANLSKNNNNLEMKDFIVLLTTIVVGKLIGYIRFPITDISIGSSGGILCCGIVVGVLKNKCVNYNLFRNIGLFLFLSGTSLSAGINFSSFSLFMNTLVGLVLTIIPILFGYILCQLLKISVWESLYIVAGGMTSSPAFGILEQNDAMPTYVPLYSISYLGALCTIIFSVRFL